MALLIDAIQWLFSISLAAPITSFVESQVLVRVKACFAFLSVKEEIKIHPMGILQETYISQEFWDLCCPTPNNYQNGGQFAS
mgnify:CR=1 FL=1